MGAFFPWVNKACAQTVQLHTDRGKHFENESVDVVESYLSLDRFKDPLCAPHRWLSRSCPAGWKAASPKPAGLRLCCSVHSRARSSINNVSFPEDTHMVITIKIIKC